MAMKVIVSFMEFMGIFMLQQSWFIQSA